MPIDVAQAALVDFAKHITGYLHLAQLVGFSLVGAVYHDQKKRFKDGRLIRTSSVREFVDWKGYWVALTFTGSSYVLVDPSSTWECYWNGL